MRRLTLIITLAACTALAGCEELFAPQDGGGSSGGNSRKPGGGPPALYQGPSQAEVRHLLSSYPNWTTPSSLQASNGVPPNVPIGAQCMRDTYVAAAIAYAWAAESYYRLNDPQSAQMASGMRSELNRANALCSNAPGFGPSTCRTLSVWGCPPPM